MCNYREKFLISEDSFLFQRKCFDIFKGKSVDNIKIFLHNNIENILESFSRFENQSEEIQSKTNKKNSAIKDNAIIGIDDIIEKTLECCKFAYDEKLWFKYSSDNAGTNNTIIAIDKEFVKDYIMPDVVCEVMLYYLRGVMYKLESAAACENRWHSLLYDKKYVLDKEKKVKKQVSTMSDKRWYEKVNCLLETVIADIFGVSNSRNILNFSVKKETCCNGEFCIEPLVNNLNVDNKIKYYMPYNSLLLYAITKSLTYNSQNKTVKIEPNKYIFHIHLLENFLEGYFATNSKDSKKNIFDLKSLEFYLLERLFDSNLIIKIVALSREFKIAQDKIMPMTLGELYKELSVLPISLGRLRLVDIFNNMREVTVSDEFKMFFNLSDKSVCDKKILQAMTKYITYELWPLLTAHFAVLIKDAVTKESNTDDIAENLNTQESDKLDIIAYIKFAMGNDSTILNKSIDEYISLCSNYLNDKINSKSKLGIAEDNILKCIMEQNTYKYSILCEKYGKPKINECTDAELNGNYFNIKKYIEEMKDNDNKDDKDNKVRFIKYFLYDDVTKIYSNIQFTSALRV